MRTTDKLRQFPFVIDHGQQISFSTLAHLIESIWLQDKLQQKFMEEYSGKNADVLTVSLRSEMLASIWTTVSTLYYIDQLLRIPHSVLSDVYAGSELSQYSPRATELRNARDHMRSNIGNLRSAKNLTPTNGVVAWTFNPALDEEPSQVTQQVFSIDPMLKAFSIDLRNGIEGVHRRLDNLTLFAFNKHLNISRAMDALRRYEAALDKELDAAIQSGIRETWPRKSDLSASEQDAICVHLIVSR